MKSHLLTKTLHLFKSQWDDSTKFLCDQLAIYQRRETAKQE